MNLLSQRILITGITGFVGSHLADLILVMSVEPGYGGQDFHEDAVESVRHYKEVYPNKIIEVDGGVAPSNSERLADAGADILVAGRAIF